MTTVHAHTRHFTASAIVIDADRRLVLLVDHKAEGRRQFPGGHVDPDETGDEAALREVLEETGVRAKIWTPPASLSLPYGRALPNPIMIAEFPAPANEGQPAHHHIDLLYVATADSTAPLTHQPEENDGAVWLSVDTLDTAAVRPDVPGAARAAMELLTAPISPLAQFTDGTQVQFDGMAAVVIDHTTRQQRQWAQVVLETDRGDVDVQVDPSVYETLTPGSLRAGTHWRIVGRVDMRYDKPRLVALSVSSGLGRAVRA